MLASIVDPFEDFETLFDPHLISVSHWLELRDLSRGVVRLTGALGSMEAAHLMALLDEILERRMTQVEVHLLSSGGDAYSALAVHDAMKRLSLAGVRVVAVVDGCAASAACMIVLQAADHRVARPSSRLLVHPLRRWSFGLERTGDTEDELREMHDLTTSISRIIAARSGRAPDEVEALFKRREVWMSALEAQGYGLVDEVA